MVIRTRLDIKGKAMVFNTITIVNWTPLFEYQECAYTILQQFEETLSHFKVTVSAYVLMPSHLHALLGYQEIESMSRFIQSFKSLSARRLQPLIPSKWSDIFFKNGKYTLWKPRFDDLVIYSKKQFKIKSDYIHNNPVKAGLAKHPTDYIYSSAGDWLFDRPGLIKIDKNWEWLSE